MQLDVGMGEGGIGEEATLKRKCGRRPREKAELTDRKREVSLETPTEATSLERSQRRRNKVIRLEPTEKPRNQSKEPRHVSPPTIVPALTSAPAAMKPKNSMLAWLGLAQPSTAPVAEAGAAQHARTPSREHERSPTATSSTRTSKRAVAGMQAHALSRRLRRCVNLAALRTPTVSHRKR